MKIKVLGILILVLGLFIAFINVPVKADTYNFKYDTTNSGNTIADGIANGDTYNYKYQNTNSIPVDNEGFINYQDQAYLKKTVSENPSKQGLFDVTLDIKGNQISHPVDIVLVIDYSSSMNGEKLSNALKGLQEFGKELGTSLTSGNVRIGLVAYNRYVYSTNGFSSNMAELEDFLTNTAESHTGTFMQKGLIAGENLIKNQSRPEATKMLIHIGDSSANRSFIPVEGAQTYTNNGELVDYNGFHTNSYFKDFQVDSDKYDTSDTVSDPNATIVDKSVVTDATLGTAVAIKEDGIQLYSIATAPTQRGEYIARNLASSEKNYHSIDENLTGLGEALKQIANSVDKTIPNGVVNDPMGKDILLQGIGNFTPDSYIIEGWRKNTNGDWIPANDLVETVAVSESNQIINLSNIVLGANERITFTYSIRINTEANTFRGNYWYLCNDRTTLDPKGAGGLLDFPIPSIKAPKTQLNIEKKWVNTPSSIIPEKIDYKITRSPIISEQGWQSSPVLSLKKNNEFKDSVSTILIDASTSDLPTYNNVGDTIKYSVQEVNVPEEFESSLTNENNNFTLINTYKITPPPVTTEPSSNSSSSSSSEEPSTADTDSTKSQQTTTSSNQIKKTWPTSSTNNYPSKEYPRTNDTKSSILWIALGVSLFGTGCYLIKKN